MIVATTLSLHSSQNSIPLTSCPSPATMVQLRPASTATSSEQFAPSLLLTAKTASMFSIRYSLFFRRFSAAILCYQQHPASFLQNRGVGVTTHAARVRTWVKGRRPLKFHLELISCCKAVSNGTIQTASFQWQP